MIDRTQTAAPAGRKIAGARLSWAGALLALLSWLPHVRLPDGALLNLTALKMLSSALAPLVALLGATAAWLGWRSGDRLAKALGLLGGIVAGAHVARVTAHHKAFEQGLGIDWRKRIPPEIQRRWLPRRYTPLRLSPADVPCERNVPFAIHEETGTTLLADLWRPPASVQSSGMGVIYLHNSGWHYLDKDTLTRPWFRYLARQGHVMMDVAYSLAPNNVGASGRSPLHAMLADVNRAVVWLKANAQRYGVDAGRIALMGASAGGHLALLAAYTPQIVEALPPKNPQADTSVCGVVSLYGITDLESAHRYFQRIPSAGERTQSLLRFLGVAPRTGRVVSPPDFIPSVLGGLPNEPALRHHPGSPLNHVGPESPPTLLIHGSHDFGVEVAQSRVMYRALRAAGVPAVFVELAEADHAFDLFFMEYAPAFQAAVYDVERFLAWLGQG